MALLMKHIKLSYNIKTLKACIPCADPETFVRGGGGGSAFDKVYFSLIGPLYAGNHRPASEIPAFAGVLMMA